MAAQLQLKNYTTNTIHHKPKPQMMSKSQYLNYLAIQILEEMGNKNPSQKEIDQMESQVALFKLKLSKYK